MKYLTLTIVWMAIITTMVCQQETVLDEEQTTFVKLSLRPDTPFVYKYLYDIDSSKPKVEKLFLLQKTEKPIRVAFGYEVAPTIKDGIIINSLTIFDMITVFAAEFDYSDLHDKAYISIFSVDASYEIELQILFQDYKGHRVDVTSRNQVSSVNYSVELTNSSFIFYKINYEGSRQDQIYLHNELFYDEDSDQRVSKLTCKFVQDFESFTGFKDLFDNLALEIKSANQLEVPKTITTDSFFIICKLVPDWTHSKNLGNGDDISVFTGYINLHINMKFENIPLSKSAKELETNTYFKIPKSNNQIVFTITEIEEGSELIIYFSLVFLDGTDKEQIDMTKVELSAPFSESTATLSKINRSSALGYYTKPGAVIINNLNYDSYVKFSISPKVLAEPVQLSSYPDFTFFKFDSNEKTQTYYVRIGDNQFNGLIVAGEDYKITKVEADFSSDSNINRWGARFQVKYFYKETSYLTFIPEVLLKVTVTKFQETTSKDVPALGAFRYSDKAIQPNYLNEDDGQNFSHQGNDVYIKKYYLLKTRLKAKAYVASFYRISSSGYSYFRMNGSKDFCSNRCTKYFDSFSYFRTQFLNVEQPNGNIKGAYVDQDYLTKLRDSDSTQLIYTFEYKMEKKDSKLSIHLKNYNKWLDFSGSNVVYYGIASTSSNVGYDSMLFNPIDSIPLKAADADGVIRLSVGYKDNSKGMYLNILAYDNISGVSKRYDTIYAAFEDPVEPEKDYRLLAGLMFGGLGLILIIIWVYFLISIKRRPSRPKPEVATDEALLS